MATRKVISWCFYVDWGSLRRLPEYLFGLRCNQRAARLWFPEWELRLYVDAPALDRNPEIALFLDEYSRFYEPGFSIIRCTGGTNMMIERFRPFFEPDVAVCIVRDLDSILSKHDADRIHAWLADAGSDVLRYREYLMSRSWAMGGGVAFKRCAALVEFPLVTARGRGHDEPILAQLLAKVPAQRQTEVVTRMLENGVYCLFTVDRAHVTVLWSVPFFWARLGYAEIPGWDTDVPYPDEVPKIVEFCRSQLIRSQHVYSHYLHRRQSITQNANWIR